MMIDGIPTNEEVQFRRPRVSDLTNTSRILQLLFFLLV